MEDARARPITSLLLGLIVGVCLSVLLQQSGVWPLDKLTVFLLPAVVALIFILIQRIGRVSSPVALVIALILLIAPVAYGLTGIGEIGESGELNGGCTVEAESDVDTTVVTDTTRSSPFDVEPDGGLSWFASSPGPITDHEWEIWVVVGGFEYVIADGGEANSDLTLTSDGDEPEVRGYVEDLGIRAGDQIRGVYEVGGFIEGTGGACDGFGFVRIRGPFLGTIIAWIALVLGLIALAIFLLIVFSKRKRPVAGDAVVVDRSSESTVAGAAGGTAAAVGDRDDDAAPEPPPNRGRHENDNPSDF